MMVFQGQDKIMASFTAVLHLNQCNYEILGILSTQKVGMVPPNKTGAIKWNQCNKQFCCLPQACLCDLSYNVKITKEYRH